MLGTIQGRYGTPVVRELCSHVEMFPHRLPVDPISRQVTIKEHRLAANHTKQSVSGRFIERVLHAKAP